MGVTTQNPKLYKALDIEDKGDRVERYHRLTVEEAGQIISTMGCEHPEELTRQMLRRKVTATQSISYETLYRWLTPGELFEGVEGGWGEDWDYADPDKFTPGHPGKYVFKGRSPLEPGDVMPADDREPALSGARGGERGTESATPRTSGPSAGQASEANPGQSTAGTSRRPEGQPGNAAGAQHTTSDPSPDSDHVDPSDDSRTRNPGLA